MKGRDLNRFIHIEVLPTLRKAGTCSMGGDLVSLVFENHSVRLILNERGEPLFVAADVYAALDWITPSRR
jgi:prophage antirepressor-like protein